MSWIENISAEAIISGHHANAGPNSILIQITSPAAWPPAPKEKFKEIYHYEFLDQEEDDTEMEEEWKISDDQAEQIVRVLTKALANNMNVVVHCNQGISRSGAVAEIGVMMGFGDLGRYRMSNQLVKTKLLRALGQ